MTEFEQLVAREEITIEIKPRPPLDPAWSTWDVALKYDRRRYNVVFHTPYGTAPTVAHVLGTLIDEIKTFGDTDGTFEQWAARNHMNLDSRSAYATWKSIVESAPKLKQFLGSKQAEFLRARG